MIETNSGEDILNQCKAIAEATQSMLKILAASSNSAIAAHKLSYTVAEIISELNTDILFAKSGTYKGKSFITSHRLWVFKDSSGQNGFQIFAEYFKSAVTNEKGLKEGIVQLSSAIDYLEQTHACTTSPCSIFHSQDMSDSIKKIEISIRQLSDKGLT